MLDVLKEDKHICHIAHIQTHLMYTYLALGDSYTIGEQVRMEDNFPHQLVRLLQEEHIETAAPVIIAQTGWTTDELAAAIREHNIREEFSFVTLLIGVNNQYRGRAVDNYASELTDLLNQAIAFAGGKANHVFVLSIPDWAATPFAITEGKDIEKAAKEIDEYNDTCKGIATGAGCHYLYITDSTRENAGNTGFLTTDNLHPSAMEYAIWAERLTPVVAEALKSSN